MPKPVQMLTPAQKFELWQMRESGVPFKDCQSWFKCSKPTLDRAMREMRVKLGRLEQVGKRKQYARTHLTCVSRQLNDA